MVYHVGTVYFLLFCSSEEPPKSCSTHLDSPVKFFHIYSNFLYYLKYMNVAALTTH